MGAAHAKPCGRSAGTGLNRAYSKRAGNADPPRALINLARLQTPPLFGPLGCVCFLFGVALTGLNLGAAPNLYEVKSSEYT